MHLSFSAHNAVPEPHSPFFLDRAFTITAKEKGATESANPLISMVGDAGFEPATSAV
jgi:hypothetical protein